LGFVIATKCSHSSLDNTKVKVTTIEGDKLLQPKITIGCSEYSGADSIIVQSIIFIIDWLVLIVVMKLYF
jgi:hypothetical protein